MKRSTRGRRPPKPHGAGMHREPQYLVSDALADRLRAAAAGWSKLADKFNWTPAGQACLAITCALAALVRLLTTWDTPEGEAIAAAAFALGNVPERSAPPPPAGLPPSAPLDWSDPAAVSRWLGAVRVTIGDAAAIAEDMLRPPRMRELGPALHRERYQDTATQLRQLLDFATVREPDDGEPGDTTGNGGAGPPH